MPPGMRAGGQTGARAGTVSGRRWRNTSQVTDPSHVPSLRGESFVVAAGFQSVSAGIIKPRLPGPDRSIDTSVARKIHPGNRWIDQLGRGGRELKAPRARFGRAPPGPLAVHLIRLPLSFFTLVAVQCPPANHQLREYAFAFALPCLSDTHPLTLHSNVMRHCTVARTLQ